jgi:molybdenum cofactor biosynthesis protein B
MSDVVQQHHQTSPTSLSAAVVTVSDTRTIETDTGGQTVIDLWTAAGHKVVARQIIPDDPLRMTELLKWFFQQADCDAILLTGGTGISSRDQTFETVSGLIEKPIPGYGELFRLLSYQEIGAAAMLSRAVAGIAHGKLIATMPGSPAGVRLAMTKLIVPEAPHIVREAKR